MHGLCALRRAGQFHPREFAKPSWGPGVFSSSSGTVVLLDIIPSAFWWIWLRQAIRSIFGRQAGGFASKPYLPVPA